MLCVLLIIYTKFNLRRIINPRYENARRGLKPRQIFTTPPPPPPPPSETQETQKPTDLITTSGHLGGGWGGGVPTKTTNF